jgi:putative membrane protein
MKKAEHVFTAMLCVFYGVGIAGHIHAVTRHSIVRLTPIVLLVYGLAVLYFSTHLKRRLLVWCACTYVVTFFIEVLGVQTGSVFGQYYYGEMLGVKVLDVPLVIGFNWVLVVLGAVHLARKMVKNDLLIAAAAGMVTVIFDIPLEVVAVKLDYWHWTSGGVPLQNYLAWFCISFIMAYVFCRMKLDVKGNIPVYYLGAQFVFFIVIAACVPSLN